jgi:transformer-2 protein
MSDKDSNNSPAASPDVHDDSASRSPKSPRGDASSASPKSSPSRATGGDRSPRTNDENEDDAAREDSSVAARTRDEEDSERRRATSRSPSPSGRKDAPAEADPEATNLGNNLYVANLPHRLTQTDLEELFAKFGRLDKCEVILDPVTRESRGFGFVTFEDVRDASDAVTELNGKEIQGRRIRVEHAKRQRGHEKTPGKYLGPRLASTKYRDVRGGGRDRSRSRERPRRSRSRSRDRGYARRYDDRERYDRPRYDDRGDRGRGGYDRDDRYDGRRSRR